MVPVKNLNSDGAFDGFKKPASPPRYDSDEANSHDQQEDDLVILPIPPKNIVLVDLSDDEDKANIAASVGPKNFNDIPEKRAYERS